MGPGPRPLLVLGSPRSGTTLIGSYLASDPRVLKLGEFGGFHLAYNIARNTLGAIPGCFREEYLADVAIHARRFAEQRAAEHGCQWYCDSTPWNLLVAEHLARDLANAVFVLTIRHYAGTIQSLRRSFASGYQWAGATWRDSAAVWTAFYRSVDHLPADRTVVVSYDALVADPPSTLAALHQGLSRNDVAVDRLDPAQLAVSHAPPRGAGARPTIGTAGAGGIQLAPISSFEADHWNADIQRQIWPTVEAAHWHLQRRYPGTYASPPAPGLPPGW